MAWLDPYPDNWKPILLAALAEDIFTGDVSGSVFEPHEVVNFYIECQAAGILCGAQLAAEAFDACSDIPDRVKTETLTDGSAVYPGDIVLRGRAPATTVLKAERTALNFLTMLSGTASLTKKYVNLVSDLGTKIIDTRKTLPGLRSLQKYAVRCGGGANNRMGLYDAVMLKDNHIAAAGSISKAVSEVKKHIPHTMSIVVECESLEMVEEAISAGADVVMLDNMRPADMSDIIAKHGGKVIFEGSGSVSLANVRSVAETGVDVISVGALTHSAPALSFHLELGTPSKS